MSINTIGLRELRENTKEYISKISKGRSFIVMKKNKPIFKVGPVDVWGDDGSWEQVADFSVVGERGVPAKDLLKTLEKLNG